MFEGEKTLVFWIGLLVFGYSFAQFCGGIWDVVYYVAIYPRLLPNSLSNQTWALFEAQAVYPAISMVISGVIFAVIGLYMMTKGVKREQLSSQSKALDELVRG